MADLKISELTNLTAADPANDMIPIVDVSATPPASGSTKRISINNILACSPSATLASATISGDLTVDTSTLYVSSSTDKVGIGTTSLSNEKLTVAGNISANAWLGRSNISAPTGDCSIFRSADNTLGFGIASTTAMTLNSTGLNIANGNVILGTSGKGIDFSATASGSGTMTSELLSDYEEGTWTATLTGSTTNPTTPVTATGRYTKIGRQVQIQLAITGANTTGAAGSVQITGVPFAPAEISFGVLQSEFGITFTGTLGCYIAAAATTIVASATASSAGRSDGTHNAGTNRFFWLNITYTV